MHSLASCLAAAHISLALSLVAMYRIPPNASGTTLAHHGSQWLNTRHLMFHEKCRIAGAEVASWSAQNDEERQIAAGYREQVLEELHAQCGFLDAATKERRRVGTASLVVLYVSIDHDRYR